MRCPPQGIHVCCSPRHVAAVTARDALPITGDTRALVNIKSFLGLVSKRDVGVSVPGTLRQCLLSHKKLFPTAHFSYLRVTVTGNVHHLIIRGGIYIYFSQAPSSHEEPTRFLPKKKRF